MAAPLAEASTAIKVASSSRSSWTELGISNSGLPASSRVRVARLAVGNASLTLSRLKTIAPIRPLNPAFGPGARPKAGRVHPEKGPSDLQLNPPSLTGFSATNKQSVSFCELRSARTRAEADNQTVTTLPDQGQERSRNGCLLSPEAMGGHMLLSSYVR